MKQELLAHDTLPCHTCAVDQYFPEGSALWLVTHNAAVSQTFSIAVARGIHPPWLTAHETHPVNFTELVNWQPFGMFCFVYFVFFVGFVCFLRTL